MRKLDTATSEIAHIILSSLHKVHLDERDINLKEIKGSSKPLSIRASLKLREKFWLLLFLSCFNYFNDVVIKGIFLKLGSQVTQQQKVWLQYPQFVYTSTF